jgi:hypothetical protein
MPRTHHPPEALRRQRAIEALRRQRAIEQLEGFVVASAAYVAAEDPQEPPSDAAVDGLAKVGRRAIRRHLEAVDPQRRRPIDAEFMGEILLCATRAMTEAWATTGAAFPAPRPDIQTPLIPPPSQ